MRTLVDERKKEFIYIKAGKYRFKVKQRQLLNTKTSLGGIKKWIIMKVFSEISAFWLVLKAL